MVNSPSWISRYSWAIGRLPLRLMNSAYIMASSSVTAKKTATLPPDPVAGLTMHGNPTKSIVDGRGYNRSPWRRDTDLPEAFERHFLVRAEIDHFSSVGKQGDSGAGQLLQGLAQQNHGLFPPGYQPCGTCLTAGIDDTFHVVIPVHTIGCSESRVVEAIGGRRNVAANILRIRRPVAAPYKVPSPGKHRQSPQS